jgi:ubiquitin-protein ligase
MRSRFSIKRVRKELSVLWVDPPAFCRPGASPMTDPYHFEVIIDGPAGSPYAGGTFPLDVVLPEDYPFKPIKLTFKTKVRRRRTNELIELHLPLLLPERHRSIFFFSKRSNEAIEFNYQKDIDRWIGV